MYTIWYIINKRDRNLHRGRPFAFRRRTLSWTSSRAFAPLMSSKVVLMAGSSLCSSVSAVCVTWSATFSRTHRLDSWTPSKTRINFFCREDRKVCFLSALSTHKNDENSFLSPRTFLKKVMLLHKIWI